MANAGTACPEAANAMDMVSLHITSGRIQVVLSRIPRVALSPMVTWPRLFIGGPFIPHQWHG
jgi:hypothetical protein